MAFSSTALLSCNVDFSSGGQRIFFFTKQKGLSKTLMREFNNFFLSKENNKLSYDFVAHCENYCMQSVRTRSQTVCNKSPGLIQPCVQPAMSCRPGLLDHIFLRGRSCRSHGTLRCVTPARAPAKRLARPHLWKPRGMFLSKFFR